MSHLSYIYVASSERQAKNGVIRRNQLALQGCLGRRQPDGTAGSTYTDLPIRTAWIVCSFVAAPHLPPRHIAESDTAQLRRCHCHNGSQDNHRHVRRTLRHELGLLDSVFKNELGCFLIACSCPVGGFGTSFLLHPAPCRHSLQFPPLPFFLFQFAP